MGADKSADRNLKQDDLSTINAKWKHSLDTGDPYNVEFRCRRYDGEYRWMLGRALPLRDPNTGEITKWYGTTTDIHDMVEARTAERATRAQLSEALTHAELTLWAVDRNRRFTMLEGMGDFIGTKRGFPFECIA